MMEDADPLLEKADALMQRIRGAVGPTGSADDVPVLTEVVASEDAAVPVPAEPASPVIDEAHLQQLVNQRLALLLPTLRRQLAQELDAWFDQQLPQIVMSLLDGFTDRLIGQISVQVRGDLMTWLQTAGEDFNADHLDAKPPAG
jgi:hypothetical protein